MARCRTALPNSCIPRLKKWSHILIINFLSPLAPLTIAIQYTFTPLVIPYFCYFGFYLCFYSNFCINVSYIVNGSVSAPQQGMPGQIPWQKYLHPGYCPWQSKVEIIKLYIQLFWPPLLKWLMTCLWPAMSSGLAPPLIWMHLVNKWKYNAISIIQY